MVFGGTNRRSGRGRAILIVIGLAIACLPLYANRIVAAAGIEANFFRGPPSVLLWNWLAVALILLFIVRVERLGLGSIGLRRPRAADTSWAVGFFALATGTSSIVTSLVPPTHLDGMDLLLALPPPVLIALIITTAVTEEILHRGYPIERLASVTGSLWLATAVSLSLFIAPHLLFFGPQWLLARGINVALIYALYLWRRNLPACMLLHGLGNAMILVPALNG